MQQWTYAEGIVNCMVDFQTVSVVLSYDAMDAGTIRRRALPSPRRARRGNPNQAPHGRGFAHRTGRRGGGSEGHPAQTGVCRRHYARRLQRTGHPARTGARPRSRDPCAHTGTAPRRRQGRHPVCHGAMSPETKGPEPDRGIKVHRVVAKSTLFSKISTPPAPHRTAAQENFGTGAVAGPYGQILQIATSVPHERSWHSARRENRTTRAWIPQGNKKAQVQLRRASPIVPPLKTSGRPGNLMPL